MSVSAIFKRLMTANLKVLHTAGFIDDNGKRTDVGETNLHAILFEKYEKELVEKAKELIAEKQEKAK